MKNGSPRVFRRHKRALCRRPDRITGVSGDRILNTATTIGILSLKRETKAEQNFTRYFTIDGQSWSFETRGVPNNKTRSITPCIDCADTQCVMSDACKVLESEIEAGQWMLPVKAGSRMQQDLECLRRYFASIYLEGPGHK